MRAIGRLSVVLTFLSSPAALFAQAAPDTAEPGSIEEIAKATTEPRFLSPWVAYVPASVSALAARLPASDCRRARRAREFGHAYAYAARSPRLRRA